MRKIVMAIAALAAGTGTYFYLAMVPDEYVIPIEYPPGIATTNYWWDLQSTTNFRDWVTEQTNLGPEDVRVTNDQPMKLYRMRGRP